MKEEREKIDFLLQRNTTEQLENVDWDKLNTAILKKLDEAESNKLCAKRYSVVFKIAAGITVAAAAVIFIFVMVKTEPSYTVRFEKNGKAVVTLKDKKEASVVSLELLDSKARAMVDFEDSSRKLAKCDIMINDFEGSLKEDSDQPMWIIIIKSKPAVADNGYNNNDELDLAYLM